MDVYKCGGFGRPKDDEEIVRIARMPCVPVARSRGLPGVRRCGESAIYIRAPLSPSVSLCVLCPPLCFALSSLRPSRRRRVLRHTEVGARMYLSGYLRGLMAAWAVYFAPLYFNFAGVLLSWAVSGDRLILRKAMPPAALLFDEALTPTSSGVRGG